MEDDLNIFQMEDNLNYVENVRWSQLFGKWKTTSIISKQKMTQLFWQMEDDLNI